MSNDNVGLVLTRQGRWGLVFFVLGMCCEQGLISGGLGNNTMVALFPGMCEIKNKIGMALFPSWTLMPIRTRFNKETSVFDCHEGQVDSGHFENNICSTSGFGKLVHHGDVHENHFNTIIWIPVGHDVAMIPLEDVRSDLTVGIVEMSKKGFNSHCLVCNVGNDIAMLTCNDHPQQPKSSV